MEFREIQNIVFCTDPSCGRFFEMPNGVVPCVLPCGHEAWSAVLSATQLKKEFFNINVKEYGEE